MEASNEEPDLVVLACRPDDLSDYPPVNLPYPEITDAHTQETCTNQNCCATIWVGPNQWLQREIAAFAGKHVITLCYRCAAYASRQWRIERVVALDKPLNEQ